MLYGPDDQAHARASDPDTSHKAAKAITPEITYIQRRILRYAIKLGGRGFTDLDLYENFKEAGSTYRSRRAELRDAGYIADSGGRWHRPRGGRGFVVWAITPKGEAAYAKK